MSGKVSKKYQELRNRLLKILANVEAKIDFPDEDLPEDILKNIKKLKKMNDQEAIKYLVQVEGIGVWTAEMFLFLFFSPIETPAKVPPVPTAHVKASTEPAV